MTDDPRRANLKPFVKGKSGNPAGRPRGTVNLTSAIRRVLKRPCEDDEDKRTYAELFALSLVTNAIKGNGPAIKQILDRIEGPTELPVRHAQSKDPSGKTEPWVIEVDIATNADAQAQDQLPPISEAS